MSRARGFRCRKTSFSFQILGIRGRAWGRFPGSDRQKMKEKKVSRFWEILPGDAAGVFIVQEMRTQAIPVFLLLPGDIVGRLGDAAGKMSGRYGPGKAAADVQEMLPALLLVFGEMLPGLLSVRSGDAAGVAGVLIMCRCSGRFSWSGA